MKNKIYKLDFSRTEDYLNENFANWLFFIDKIIKKEIVSQGKFYCVGPEDFEKYNMYDFYNVKENDEIKYLGFMIHCIKEKKCHYIFENIILMEDSEFWKTDMTYYFAEESPFFYIDENFTKDQILQAKILCGTWGFVPFIIDVNLDFHKVNTQDKIDAEMEQKIIDNVVFFSTEIYDRRSILFWVKDGYDHLINELNKFI